MRIMLAILLVAAVAGHSTVASGQWPEDNTFELTTDPEWYEPECIIFDGVHTVRLYVHAPVNNDFDGDNYRAVRQISGFECKIEVFGTVMIAAVRYPVPAINAGSDDNYVVGFSEPILAHVTTLLAEFDVIGTPPAAGVTAAPRSRDKSPIDCDHYAGHLLLGETDRPSLPGQMAFVDAEDPIDPLIGAHRARIDPRADVWLEPRPVSTATDNWGSVKALYR